MKKKIILFTFVVSTANVLYAQDAGGTTYVLDELEDTTNVTTVKDIIKKKRKVFSTVSNSDHLKNVWSRKSFFNISYLNETLTPVETDNGTTTPGVPITNPETADGYLNKGMAVEYKSDWGISLQDGTNYRLHKKPIANLLTIHLDYSWFELSAAHFKAEESLNNLKVVDNTYYEKSTERQFFTPFNAEKYEFNYGMTLGPSLTIAPFTPISSASGLHFFKFNAYFHIGYNVSLLLLNNNDSENQNRNNNNDGVSMDFGHGLCTSFGVNLSWKAIGVGFEKRQTSYQYKSIKTDTYGDDKYKFDSNSTRFYVQFRF